MKSHKKIARIVGVLYIIGTIAGILSLVLTGSILGSADYLSAVSANKNKVIIGALFVLTMAFALAMVPVVLYPILKKYNQPLALGYVVFRGALETFASLALVISWLILIVLSQEYVNVGVPDASYFHTLGTLMLGAIDWIDLISTITFSLGALMLYYIFYKSKLVPRWISVWGLVGIALVLAVGLLGMFGISLQILWGPLALQEMVMAVWLIVKGFNQSAIAPVSTKKINKLSNL